MNNDLKKGIFYSVSSALVFGITPVLASLTFQLGSNALTLTFYRNGMVVPVLLIILLIRKVDLRIKPKELLALTVISVVFSATTTFLVYAAYPYIGVGLATTLHFLYPVFTVFLGWLLFRKKMDRVKVFALLLATAGVAMATGEGGTFALQGILMAVISAVTYAGYMLGIEHSVIARMDSMKSMFYMCIINAIAVAVIDLPTGSVIYGLQPLALFYTFVLAVANSAVAYVILIKGIKLIGAGNAAIFSMLEPVSGVAAGVVFLGEKLPLMKFVSCAMILCAVMIPILRDRNSSGNEGIKDE